MTKTHKDYQKTYRDSLDKKGLVRYELQIPSDTKEQLDKLAITIANEFAHGSEQTKLRLAKQRLIEELVAGLKHDFFDLRDKIEKQKVIIKALSPTFNVKTDDHPIPDSIQKLTNDPEELKRLITKLHVENASLRVQKEEYKRRSEQYLRLYETVAP